MGRRKIEFSDEEKNRIIELSKTSNPTAIAKEFQRSPEVIRRVYKELNLPLVTRTHRYLPQETVETIKALRASGKTIVQIATELNLPRGTVANHTEKVAVDLTQASEHPAFRWRRLSPMGSAATRILSLPAVLLQNIGFDKNDELKARWQIENGKLTLEVQRA